MSIDSKGRKRNFVKVIAMTNSQQHTTLDSDRINSLGIRANERASANEGGEFH
jgi:hypothetical protein